jgi:PII-like signaling protein
LWATFERCNEGAVGVASTEVFMLQTGKALKVSIYLSEGDSRHAAILDYLFFRGVAGAAVLRGVAGFGADHRLHSASYVEISDKLPLKIEFVESEQKVEQLLGKLEAMAGNGMIEVQETRIVKLSTPPKHKVAEAQPPLRMEGKAKLMRIYIGEDDRWNDKSLYKMLVEAMRANDLAGATVYRGILGYGAHRRVHRDKPFHLSHDASIMISVVDTEEKIRNFLPVLERMVQEGLIVLSDVDVVKYSHRAIHAGESVEGRN